jgi:allantoate deiminase
VTFLGDESFSVEADGHKYAPWGFDKGENGSVGSNIIPESVEFSLDIRDIDLERRNNIIRKIEVKIKHVSEARRLDYEIERNVDAVPVKCSENLIHSFKEACRDLGIDVPILVSGSGHDVMLLAEITEIGMVFVRCRNGISHQPKEWADIVDIVLGTRLLYETVLKGHLDGHTKGFVQLNCSEYFLFYKC